MNRRSHRAKAACGVCALLVATLSSTAHADPRDPAGARELLKRGYELKQAGKCEDAVPLFRESQKLDPQVKTLLNMADCEAAIGRLVASEVHYVEGRDLAYREGNPELSTIAEERLTALHARLAQLTIKLAAGAPSETKIVRDGVELGAVALGSPMPVDPGEHQVIARAPGREPRAYRIKLVEGESASLEVDTGGPARSPSQAAPVVTPPPVSEPRPLTDEAPKRGQSSQKTWAYAAGGIGVIGIGLGAYFGIRAIDKNSASNEGGHCTNGCDATGYDLREDAVRSATISSVAFVVGAAALGAGAVLFLTAPSSGGRRALRVAPEVSGQHAGLGISGDF